MSTIPIGPMSLAGFWVNKNIVTMIGASRENSYEIPIGNFMFEVFFTNNESGAYYFDSQKVADEARSKIIKELEEV